MTLAAADARPTSAEVRELWSGMMERFADEASAAIEAERARGAAPDGLPARDLAIAVNWMTERVLHTTFAATAPAIDEARALDTLVAMFLKAIYGIVPTGVAP